MQQPHIKSDSSNDKSGYKVLVKGMINGQYYCSPDNILTDSNGFFSIGEIKEGLGYRLEVSKVGYLTRIIDGVNITNNDNTQIVNINTSANPFVLWPGDINQDNAINMSDVMGIAQRFNVTYQDSKYDLLCDLDRNNAINMSDVIIIAGHFNKSISGYPQYFLKFNNGKLTLNEDTVVDGNYTLQNNTIDLNGHSLTINGNLTQTSTEETSKNSIININNGTLTVNGDYKLQNWSTLLMRNSKDKVIVNGNFIDVSRIDHCLNNQQSGDGKPCLTNGTLEVKGNFLQGVDNTNTPVAVNVIMGNPANFHTSGGHKVILSGTSTQTVIFVSAGIENNNSMFNNLEIKNTSAEGIKFGDIKEYDSNNNLITVKSKLYVNTLINTTSTNTTKLYGDVRISQIKNPLKCNLTITGNLILDLPYESTVFNLNGNKLTVTGDIIQKGGLLDVAGGQ
ncbi:hypothetical protein Bccel_5404 [Pseudobacteroides cellulosolvens ATCC 35603 = DSM 2933]|uniref:Dockerin domain-containing protein n=1 Tax=Pseudobacteroides cellulosolvens ATCC 35603 = DSM 2933 TaxID=398512 RepID=A0A0L6JXF5_9FIRM|nr:hypothetical protein Bccel_5404 [Pseudobacteroides cellulosolvens ATCC 35603 = DSM 2933]